MSFQENFLRLRAKSGYTQEDIAHRLGVSRQSVAKWEAGKSTPDLEKLIALAELFDVSLDELVRGRIKVSQGEQLEGAPAQADAPNEEAFEDGQSIPEPQDAQQAVAECDVSPAAVGDGEQATAEDGEQAAAEDSDHMASPSQGHARGGVHDKDAYLAHMSSFARMVGVGVGFCILGSAFSTFFDMLGSLASGNLLSNLLGSVFGGLQPVVANSLAGISAVVGGAVGLALLIPAGITHADYKKRHPLLDFEFSEQELNEARHILIVHLTLGIALIFLGVVVVIALSPGGDAWAQFGAAIMLVFVAIGVEELIYGGIRGSATEKHDYETEAAEMLLDSGQPLPADIDPMDAAKAQRNRIVGAICGIVMIIATIIGLTLLFVADAPLFWLAWVIGGLSCGAVSLVGDALLAARAG